MSTLEVDLDEAVAALDAEDEPVLLCHVYPDGDALGSLMAMHLLCRMHGKRSIASWSEPFVAAPHYDFLPGLELATKPADVPDAAPLVVTFDCASFARLGGLADKARHADRLVVLDHHGDNTRFGGVNVVDPGAAATAVIVRRMAAELGWALTPEVALCLYTGLVTDTGRFQYANTTPEAFQLAAELAGYGLPIGRITRRLYEEHRFAYLQLMGQVIDRAELDREHGFVGAWVTADDFAVHGVDPEEAEGLIDIVRRTTEATVTCVAKETPDGVRVSLRSLDDDGARTVDVGAVARALGGGGHAYAAGYVASVGPAEAVAQVRDAVVRGLGRVLHVP